MLDPEIKWIAAKKYFNAIFSCGLWATGRERKEHYVYQRYMKQYMTKTACVFEELTRWMKIWGLQRKRSQPLRELLRQKLKYLSKFNKH